MWDIKCRNNGRCSLSKGTQSDGLISDTSEEFTSSSSTEKFEQGIVVKQTKGQDIQGAYKSSQVSVNSKSSTNSHESQTQCQLYIKWGVLLSFGISLWVALWVMEIFNPNPFLKEDMTKVKKVTLKGDIVNDLATLKWGFLDLWSGIGNSIKSITSLDVLILLTCVTILIYLNFHARNIWTGTTGQDCYDKLCKSLSNTEIEQSDTEDSSSHSGILAEEPKNVFSQGDMRNLTMPNIESKSNIREETRSDDDNLFMRLDDSCLLGKTRKWSSEIYDGSSCSTICCKHSNPSKDLVRNRTIYNKPNFKLSCTSSESKDGELKSNLTHSSFSCSVFNKSASFISEKIETWLELPNSDQADRVLHSFDAELERLFKVRPASSSLFFGETVQNQHQFNTSAIDRTNEKKSKTTNVSKSQGIISSSPAFKKFLENLAGNTPSGINT
ncbi:uncharacterized protein LOC105693749 isoform X2 [Athalia rosae]|uniref:uncharacterized protein LOC105693749 isoform X2 n=1 Tax=Athalia rosae TaxID=37344 RepID=UPI0020338245|nr:uncharacterized protein LOC105693749 isoform X2 [Athalia rosae]